LIKYSAASAAPASFSSVNGQAWRLISWESLKAHFGDAFPLGACLATAEAAKGITFGTHGTTFGGNLLAIYKKH